MSLVVGIEGGGTRTRAWLAEGGPDAPVVLARREEGPSNFQRAGAAAVGALVEQLVSGLAREASVPAERISAVGLGLAGVGTPIDRSAVLEALKEASSQRAFEVASDARAALEGATAGKGGVLLIAGTGSIALGVAPDGREGRAGGWGHQLGDEGSGYALGRSFLRRVTQALDGRLMRSPKLELLRAHLDLPDHEAVAAWIRAHAADTSAVASLAPLVFKDAERGNHSAANLIARAAADLASMARSVQKQLGFWAAAPVVLYGGVLLGNAMYREAVTAAVHARLPEASVTTGLPDDGLKGCVRLAYRALGRTAA